MQHTFRTLAALTKFPISALSTVTAATGYLCANRALDRGIVPTALGVLLLAFGACTLNQFQERGLDAAMPRTRGRPIPSGQIAPSGALSIAFIFSLAGFWTLMLGPGVVPALLGLATLVWYNGVYTHLKRVTAFAVVPGALVGSLPPIIGWTAGGGDLSAPQGLALAFFFFVWQVPHFWLLVAIHGPEYETAGLPSLTRILSPAALSHLTFVWTCAAAASSLLLPVFGVASGRTTAILLTAGAVALCVSSVPPAAAPAPPFIRRAFRAINLFALFVCALLALDPFLAGLG